MSIFVQVARTLALVAVIGCGPLSAIAQPTQSRPPVEPRAEPSPDDHSPTAASKSELDRHDRPRLAILTSRQPDHGERRASAPAEPFGSFQIWAALPIHVSAKWADLQSRIRSEDRTLAACRSGDGDCPAAARRFLEIIELGRARQGRARIGEINRAVNLSIKPKSDLAQHGDGDFWSAPLATFTAGAGDCEDYAIAKYVALREAGIARRRPASCDRT